MAAITAQLKKAAKERMKELEGVIEEARTEYRRLALFLGNDEGDTEAPGTGETKVTGKKGGAQTPAAKKKQSEKMKEIWAKKKAAKEAAAGAANGTGTVVTADNPDLNQPEPMDPEVQEILAGSAK